jgi:hypothetical protein
MKPFPYYSQRPGGYVRMPGPEGHLALEGYMQEYLDALHIIMANHWGTNANPLEGVELFEVRLARVKAQLDKMAVDYPKQWPNAVPAGKTAKGLAGWYKAKAAELFAAYGR